MKVESPPGLTEVSAVPVHKVPPPGAQGEVRGPVSESQSLLVHVYYFPLTCVRKINHFRRSYSPQNVLVSR